MPNNLANETSPYLRQHKDNPVNWYPWGETAISRAKQEQKPIFLSIGYAACHWCHVMAHESFEDPQTAAILNQNFIAIKVDREERPDLDDIYMQAVVLLTGNGGWPLSVFLTPDLLAFYGGTYFPPEPQFRIPSFKQVLLSIINAWQNDPENLHQIADSITKSIHKQQTLHDSNEAFPDLDAISEWLISSYDWDNGGWGHAPRFPQPMVIEFLIQRAYRGDKHAYHLVDNGISVMLVEMFVHPSGRLHR
ncbi:MAG: thioredoxin domain-containing protein, partial [Anaerolineales bacterium]